MLARKRMMARLPEWKIPIQHNPKDIAVGGKTAEKNSVMSHASISRYPPAEFFNGSINAMNVVHARNVRRSKLKSVHTSILRSQTFGSQLAGVIRPAFCRKPHFQSRRLKTDSPRTKLRVHRLWYFGCATNCSLTGIRLMKITK